jgi:hypothetical protein
METGTRTKRTLTLGLKKMDKNKKPVTDNNNTSNPDESDLRKLGEEGMSILTAQVSINRKLRKEIMQKYDLQELKNLGRYFKARAYSKDGQHCYELLIDKQTNNIQVVSQSRVF